VLALGATVTDHDSIHVGGYAWTVSRDGEPFASGTGATLSLALPDAESGAVDAGDVATMQTESLAADLAAAILALSAEDRARLVALILAGPR
jgi:hypothetical protein